MSSATNTSSISPSRTRKALILRHDLFGEPSPPSWSTQVLMRAGRDQMAVQDGLHDMLEPGALPHDLVATGDLAKKRLGGLVRGPRAGSRWRRAARARRRRRVGLARQPRLPSTTSPQTRSAEHGAYRRAEQFELAVLPGHRLALKDPNLTLLTTGSFRVSRSADGARAEETGRFSARHSALPAHRPATGRGRAHWRRLPRRAHDSHES
jgi:hypothetical protein